MRSTLNEAANLLARAEPTDVGESLRKMATHFSPSPQGSR
jgi:hypothetical protein